MAARSMIGWIITLYKRLGVGIIQLTYNTQNLLGTGCYRGATAACRISGATPLRR